MAAVLPTDRLTVGIQLPIQSQSTIYAEPWEADAGADELAAVARAADEAGLGYVAVCDHVAVPTDKAETMSAAWWDTIATLGWLAGITERVRLLSHVYVPAYRHPLAVAKAWSTLDRVSGGRAVMGVGAGHVEGEFAALGVPFAERGALLDEAIDAVRACFADEVPTHDGDRWRFSGLAQRPRPVQDGGPPVWVGGSSRPAIRRAARRGDGWLPQGPLSPEVVDALRAEMVAAGREGEGFDLGALAGPIYVGDADWDVGPGIVGPPGKVAHVLSKLAGLGAVQVQVRPRSRSVAELVDQIGRLGTDVLPHLAEVRPRPLFDGGS
ncbi:TIGR03619 family F420-dependent LLM class oxidoreductase [Iamia majanohamensis]|uniref:TIGR03619 family F420-dependent LLM class oxidoreductase n=1 Tax=Iamia majanohamensis TaxID=467976 RepID=A0AAE9Y563_9ACTN|nr:TIGR03619 family F420-dependent LLM class oxidoreductase [Iamia majanohamensis]WCO65536.1 TIGR03619 family F420-dependent LLM class oxidoreductase [Iamia majanohamensis]